MTPETEDMPEMLPVADEEVSAPVLEVSQEEAGETVTPPEPPRDERRFQDIKRRLRELLSVPERERSDEVWDEIIELEIQTAPGNRLPGAPEGGVPRGPARGAPPRQAQGGQPASAQKKHNKPRGPLGNNRRPRGPKPGGGGNGGNSGGPGPGGAQA